MSAVVHIFANGRFPLSCRMRRIGQKQKLVAGLTDIRFSVKKALRHNKETYSRYVDACALVAHDFFDCSASSSLEASQAVIRASCQSDTDKFGITLRLCHPWQFQCCLTT